MSDQPQSPPPAVPGKMPTYLPEGDDFRRVGEVRDSCGGTAVLFIETAGGGPLLPSSRLQGVVQVEDQEGGCAELRMSLEICSLMLVQVTRMYDMLTAATAVEVASNGQG